MARSWQVGLPQDAADLAENLIEWRQDGHLIRESRPPERFQARFLLDDGFLEANHRLLPKG